MSNIGLVVDTTCRFCENGPGQTTTKGLGMESYQKKKKRKTKKEKNELQKPCRIEDWRKMVLETEFLGDWDLVGGKISHKIFITSSTSVSYG